MRLRNKPWADDFLASHPESLVDNPEELRGKWETRFEKKNPIFVEIGSGKGGFIAGMAKKYPDVNFIGIELQKSVLAMALKKVVNEKLSNVQLVHSDGALVNTFFKKGEIDKIFLNFSDPWPKKRHAKRRLTSSKFLASYQEVLPDKAELEFKTDNRGLFEYSLVSLNNFGMKFETVNLDLHHSGEEALAGNVETEYEKKFKEKGPIYKIVAQFID